MLTGPTNHTLTPEKLLQVSDWAEKTLILMPCYEAMAAHTYDFVTTMLSNKGRIMTCHHVPDIARARCILATNALEQIVDGLDVEWILWLDSDIALDLENLYKLYSDADNYHRSTVAAYGDKRSSRSFSARYLTKVGRKLSTGFVGTYRVTGMGCLLQPVKALEAVRDRAQLCRLWDVSDRLGWVVCATGFYIEDDGRRRWRTEADDFCLRLWEHAGGVELSTAVAIHSAIVLSMCPDDQWGAPEENPDGVATRPEQRGPRKTRKRQSSQLRVAPVPTESAEDEEPTEPSRRSGN